MNTYVFKIALPVFIFLSTMNAVQAQPSSFKPEKISISDLETNICPIDSGAQAYFIFDIGTTNFEYDQTQGKGFQLHFNRHFRMKISNKQGFEWGNISIRLYKNNSNKEEVVGLKAYTYNLENGKIEKTKLERKSILEEETSENLTTIKLAMPNIKEGSIIDVEYEIKSDFLFNLQEWYFQRMIPILYSNYAVTIPEYFNYNIKQKGYFRINTVNNSKRGHIIFNSKQRSNSKYGGNTQFYSSKVDYNEDIHTFWQENLPAFPQEKFLRTPENYISKLEFELQYIKFPQEPIKTYTSSWEDIDKRLKENDYFGQALKNGNHWQDDIEMLKSKKIQNKELINAALQLVKQKISWNGEKTKYADSNLNKAYKLGEGNSADVNLNLVILLRKLGFISNPVILSTRENGIIYPVHPSVSAFNYVIAMVDWEGETLLLDATDPYSMINLLPPRCINDKGRVIGDTSEKWINLMDQIPYMEKTSCNLYIDSTFTITGKASEKLDGYGAYRYRSEIKESTDKKQCIKSLKNEDGKFKISNVQIIGLDSTYNFQIRYDIEKEEACTQSGGMIYFSPIQEPFFEEPPFKLEKRDFPVEFNYPYKIINRYTYVAPPNYEFAEIPQPISVRTNNSSGIYTYNIGTQNNILSINTTLTISKSIFLPSEYEELKKFIQMLIDKEKELVIMKPRQL